MQEMVTFLISALRAIIEMLGLCLIGQGLLYVLAGKNRSNNPIYRLFDLITRPPRRAVARCLPSGIGGTGIGLISFSLLFAFWIGLALLRYLAIGEAASGFSAIILLLPPTQHLT